MSQGKIVGVVRRCHLNRAGTEVAAHPGIRHDRNLASGQRQLQHLAVEVSIAFIVRVNGDRHVAQHGLGPGGGHGDEAAFSHDWVADLP